MITDRPGLGRAPATNGAACVALPGRVVIEDGYRNQVSVGPGTQTLTAYPNAIFRFGLRGHNEILAAPYVYTQRAGENSALGFAPATGSQDAGLGFKHLLRDQPWAQDAVNLFATVPTGAPSGSSGFSSGLTTYTLGYSVMLPVNGFIGFSTTQNFILNAAPGASGSVQRFFSYQPAASLTFALTSKLTCLLQDQLTMPVGPSAGTGNRGLTGFQFAASPNVVFDAEFELNLLPAAGVSQHAIDAGITLLP